MKNILNNKTVKVIGYVTVYSGLVWMGDPCNVIHPNNKVQEFGNEWDDFTDKFFATEKEGATQFMADNGLDHVGVCAATTHGDGVYPVYGIYKNDELSATVIDFDGIFED